MLMSVAGIQKGYGKHMQLLQPDYLYWSFVFIFMGEVLYFILLALAKFSILAFYRRIFSDTIRVPVYVVAGITIAWLLAMVDTRSSICTLRWLITRDLGKRHHLPVLSDPAILAAHGSGGL